MEYTSHIRTVKPDRTIVSEESILVNSTLAWRPEHIEVVISGNEKAPFEIFAAHGDDPEMHLTAVVWPPNERGINVQAIQVLLKCMETATMMPGKTRPVIVREPVQTRTGHYVEQFINRPITKRQRGVVGELVDGVMHIDAGAQGVTGQKITILTQLVGTHIANFWTDICNARGAIAAKWQAAGVTNSAALPEAAPVETNAADATEAMLTAVEVAG